MEGNSCDGESVEGRFVMVSVEGRFVMVSVEGGL